MKIFLTLFFLIVSFNSYSIANEYEEICSEKRLINIESRFISDFRLDNYTIENSCDFNQIQIFEHNELIYTKIIGGGHTSISQFLEGQTKNSKNYIWLEFFPSSRNWYTYGYYFGNGKVESIDNEDLKNCKFLKENKLICRATTYRKFNPQNPRCTFEFRPYDIYELLFTGTEFKKNIIKEEPITDECK